MLPPHDPEQGAEASGFHLGAARHLGVLFVHILVDGFPVQHIEGKAGDRAVRVEAEGEVDVAIALVGLLVEVDGSHPILHLFEVRCDVDDVVDAAHVAEQTDEGALGEFRKLLGDADLVELRIR